MRILPAILILANSLVVSTAAPQVPTRLASIRVVGNQRYTLQDIEALSDLAIGKSIALTDLTDAANRLAKTGLFANVKYTYTTAGPQIAVTFEVVEAPSTVPVIFDNFVWLPDEELTKSLREYVPEFDGKTTVYAGATDLIASGLQKILEARKWPGQVSVTPVYPEGQTKSDPLGFIFAVANPAPKVCALHVSGASTIAEKDLVGQLTAVVGDAYSRSFLREVSAGTLSDMYHRKGHWRASFGAPTLALNQCDGVAVTLNVTEGSQYVWDHATWTGNTAMPSADLDKLVALKPGEAADSGRLDAAVVAVRHEYGKHGYVDANVRYVPQLDDAAHRATFAFNIREGAQYTMGTLQFVGIRDADADKLQKQWKLKPGDVFDLEYMQKYQSEVLGPLRAPSGQRPVISMNLDRDRHVANLSVAVR